MDATARRTVWGGLARAGGLVAALLLAGCSSQIEDNIDTLVKGGPDAEAARMALSMARSAAVEPLIVAFHNPKHSARARADILDALFDLYLRERDGRIKDVLRTATGDPQAPVRQMAVRCLGDLGTTEVSGALIEQLAREPDPAVKHEILVTLGIMGGTQGNNNLDVRLTTSKMSDEEKARFVELLQAILTEDGPDSLRDQAAEWLEAVAEEKIVEAAAGADGAEALLLQARDLVPDSRNVAQRLGRFYCDTGQQEKGMALLTGIGAALRVPRLAQAPVIDGKLDDAVWQSAVPIPAFYQNVRRMRPPLVAGKVKACLGQQAGRLYIGVKGYEPSTDGLQVTARNRDENAWQDDCVEVFFSPTLGRDYYQIVINSIGTVFDAHMDTGNPNGDRSWDAQLRHAVHVDPDSWTLEMEVPLDQFGAAAPQPGTVWSANLARIRIANASEYGQWSPTYGSALRPDRFGLLIF